MCRGRLSGAIIDELRRELYSVDDPFLCGQMKYVDFG
jgi:hypothetical protein